MKFRRPGHTTLDGLATILARTDASASHHFADVDGAESGSLSHLVSFDVGRSFAERRDRNFDVLLLLLTTHISAVLFYVFYIRDNLIGPRISGVRLDHPGAAPAIEIPSWRRTVVGVALAAVATWSVAAGFWS